MGCRASPVLRAPHVPLPPDVRGGGARLVTTRGAARTAQAARGGAAAGRARGRRLQLSF
jgi:hypothetical protein